MSSRTTNLVQFEGRIGVVTPYKQQMHLIRKIFEKEFGISALRMYEITTVVGSTGFVTCVG